MKRLIVGFVGYKDSGKSTTARLLRKSLETSTVASLKVDSYSFSQPIYNILIGLGVPYENVYDNDRRDDSLEDFDGKTSREMMITLGTGWGRNVISEKIWIVSGIKKIEKSKFNIVTIDGIRFPNEMEEIEKHGGVFIHIKNDRARERVEAGIVDESESHTEWLANRCDFEVDNTKYDVEKMIPLLSHLVIERYKMLQKN